LSSLGLSFIVVVTGAVMVTRAVVIIGQQWGWVYRCLGWSALVLWSCDQRWWYLVMVLVADAVDDSGDGGGCCWGRWPASSSLGWWVSGVVDGHVVGQCDTGLGVDSGGGACWH